MAQVRRKVSITDPPFGAKVEGSIRGKQPAVAPLEFKLEVTGGEGGVAGSAVLSLKTEAGSPTAMLLADALQRAAEGLRGGSGGGELDLVLPVDAQDGAHG